MVTAPVLAFPRSDAEFIVDCDASDYGLRAVISQEQDGSERVIAYASRVLDNREPVSYTHLTLPTSDLV